ncbi:MAG: formylglycine-generating enzyme family protein [Spirochaetales bacterium]|nr:formylglycine-generating enzyme family protein [Spirochaetales bacterium]
MMNYKKIICMFIALWLTFILAAEEPVKMVKIPGKDYEMSATEITQKIYESVMGENPSKFKGENLPVETVSWYDAIYFCNKLSVKYGYTPVYSVDGTKDVTKWKYTPHHKNIINGKITQNISADGFRLPTMDEWEYAANGGHDYKYAGSDNIDEVAWYSGNSHNTSHPVAQKKANGYGLYDMTGNVWEWCWNSYYNDDDNYLRGGSWDVTVYLCHVFLRKSSYAYSCDYDFGIRVVRTATPRLLNLVK